MTNFKKITVAILLIISTFTLNACSDETKAKKSTSSQVKLQERFKEQYKLYSSKSITKAPKKGLQVGDGSKVTVAYDKSQGEGLFYQLYYVDNAGAVIPMGGSFFEENKDGSFSQKITEFTSAADGKDGFLELSTVYTKPGSNADNIVANSKTINLGMYPIELKIKK